MRAHDTMSAMMHSAIIRKVQFLAFTFFLFVLFVFSLLTSPSGAWGTSPYSCPLSTMRTTRSVRRSVFSGSYFFVRLAPKAQAKAW